MLSIAKARGHVLGTKKKRETCRKTQTRSPKPVCGMCVHWRQQDGHHRNDNARDKLDHGIWAEVIKKPAKENSSDQFFFFYM